MSYYRDIYLKSEDWRNLRAAVIARDKGKCRLCSYQSPHNDVHHIQYRKLWNVLPNDLWTLCRPCHDKVHIWLKKLPKGWTPWQRWRHILENEVVNKRAALRNHFKAQSQCVSRVLLGEVGKKRQQLNHLLARLEAAKKGKKIRPLPQVHTTKKKLAIIRLGQVSNTKARYFFPVFRKLADAGKINPSLMALTPACENIPACPPDEYLALYIAATGIDPRLSTPNCPTPT